MENNLHKLFKSKLEGHSLPPSEDAWAKVEARLSKKNSAIAWRIAAAVLLAGALIPLLYWTQRKEEVVQSAVVQPAPKENTSSQPGADNVAKKIELPKNAVAEKKKPENNTDRMKAPVAVVTPKPVQQEEHVTLPLIDEQKDNTIARIKEVKPEEKLISDATPVNKVTSTVQKPIKLEFTLDDFASEENVVATNEVKNTGLKKVLALARDVKNGEGPVGNLREMKNELFALNFIKGKAKN
jgi:uncharacterized protein YktB (UPF0637 family)